MGKIVRIKREKGPGAVRIPAPPREERKDRMGRKDPAAIRNLALPNVAKAI
jgi:hypothetical protein